LASIRNYISRARVFGGEIPQAFGLPLNLQKEGLSMLPLTRYDVKIIYKGKEQVVTVYEGYNSWIFSVECLYPGAKIVDFKKGGFNSAKI